jgi:hypothetical protein
MKNIIKKLIKPKKKKRDYITKIEVTPYWANPKQIKKEIKNVK